jgi:hypothetical protein
VALTRSYSWRLTSRALVDPGINHGFEPEAGPAATGTSPNRIKADLIAGELLAVAAPSCVPAVASAPPRSMSGVGTSECGGDALVERAWRRRCWIAAVDDPEELQEYVVHALQKAGAVKLMTPARGTVLAGDGRLLERLRSEELLPLGSRMRVRLALEGGFDFDNIGPVLLEGRPFPNLDRRQRNADGLLGRGWNYRGEMLGFHGVVFQASSSSGCVCGGLQLRGATEWMNPEHLFSSGVVSVADRAPRTDQQPALPSGPSPVGSHPVSRGGRAPFDRGDPLGAVMPKFLSAS